MQGAASPLRQPTVHTVRGFPQLLSAGLVFFQNANYSHIPSFSIIPYALACCNTGTIFKNRLCLFFENFMHCAKQFNHIQPTLPHCDSFQIPQHPPPNFISSSSLSSPRSPVSAASMCTGVGAFTGAGAWTWAMNQGPYPR